MKVLPPQALAMSSVSGKRENTDGWRQLCSEVFANGRAMRYGSNCLYSDMPSNIPA